MVTEVGVPRERALHKGRRGVSGLVMSYRRGSEGMAVRAPFPGKNGARPGTMAGGAGGRSMKWEWGQTLGCMSCGPF